MRRIRRERAVLRAVRRLTVALGITATAALSSSPVAPAAPRPAQIASSQFVAEAGEGMPSPVLAYRQLAEQGVARAQRTWRDHRLGWYDERLDDHERYPLATIWGVVPLFEALNAVQIASPSTAHRSAVEVFVRGAEHYFNPSERPTPGYAPYPHDRGQPRTWFDDNGWWGIAFMDAYQATGDPRALADAERAFRFIAAQGWDNSSGGIWWNTSHPYKSGPALASDTLLGALLYKTTHRASYLAEVNKFLTWADAHFLTDFRLYSQKGDDPTPTPYVEGPMVEAHELLCQAGQAAACARATELANACWQRFEARLNMGPQFDTIYLHWMLVYAKQTGDQRWPRLARQMADEAQANALDTHSGLYLAAWDGSSITEHQAQRNMLQTDAATVELFGWLASA